jgi:hypothetical protein
MFKGEPIDWDKVVGWGCVAIWLCCMVLVAMGIL